MWGVSKALDYHVHVILYARVSYIKMYRSALSPLDFLLFLNPLLQEVIVLEHKVLKFPSRYKATIT